jgi:hypothetical protein
MLPVKDFLNVFEGRVHTNILKIIPSEITCLLKDEKWLCGWIFLAILFIDN